MMFENHYTCPECKAEWQDVWDCMVEDECPECGTRHITPDASEELPDHPGFDD